MQDSVYDYERKFQTAKRNLGQSELSGNNKRLILDFVDDCFSSGLSKARLYKYNYHLMKLGR